MTSVSVVMTNGTGNQTGSYGVREIEVYEWVPVSSPQQHTVAYGIGGQGPGNDLIPNPTAAVTPVRPNGQPPASAFQSPSPVPTTSGAPVSNGSPVDFTIVLELASGQGYGP